MAGVVDTLSREGLLDAVFGSGSKLATSNDLVANAAATGERFVRFGSDDIFGMVVAVTLIIYMVWIVKYLSHRHRGDYTNQRWIYGDEEIRAYDRVAISLGDVIISLALMLGLMSMLLPMVVDWSTTFSSSATWFNEAVQNFSESMWGIGFRMMIVGVAAYLLFATIFFAIIFYVITTIFRSAGWARVVVQLKARMIHPIMLYIMPVAIIYSLDRDNEWLSYIVAIEVVIALFVYILRSFLLFVAQKISILQWILYLCTVEILPITLVWVIFAKSVSIN